MKLCWPRRSSGLPPGQRLLQEMPRFTNRPFEPPPVLHEVSLTISVDGERRLVVGEDDLKQLGLRTFRADFHCVTSWSVINLEWTGVPLKEVLDLAGVNGQDRTYLVARAADRRRGHFLTCDALAPDVILATQLDGRNLGPRHGGPLRLVAPQHYGYKSIKHLTHVARQERHPTLPNRLVRTPYRLLIPATAYFAERSLRRHATPGMVAPGRSTPLQ